MHLIIHDMISANIIVQFNFGYNYLWTEIMYYNVHYESIFNALSISNRIWPKEAKCMIQLISSLMYHPKQSVAHLCVVYLCIGNSPKASRSWSFLCSFTFISRLGGCTLLILLAAYLMLEAAQHIPSADRGLELCLDDET